MSEIFVTPAPYGEMKLEDNKKSKLLSYPTSKLSSPYEGVVSEPLTPPCGNYIKIKHNYNNRTVYSLFCGVGKSTVTVGDKVKQGDLIGKFSDDKIEYYILDDNDKKLSIYPFFEGSVKPVPKEKETEKEKKEKDQKEKEEKNNKENNNNKKKKKTSTGESGIENVFLDMMLLPFSAIHSGTKKITGDSEEDDKKLKEHVNRIKKLLK